MSYRAWVTRDEGFDGGGEGPLCRALIACGVEPICEPVIARRACSDASEELARLTSDDWLVLTSAFAIACVHGELAKIPKVAVVGEKSAVAARARGFHVELVSPGKTAGALFEALRSVAEGRRVLYPRSSQAPPPKGPPPKIPPTETDCFGEFASPVLYETYCRDFDIGVIDKVDCVTFASPSAVRSVDKKVSLTNLALPIASIGPTTSEAVGQCGGVVAAEPATPRFASLAQVVAELEGGRKWGGDSCNEAR